MHIDELTIGDRAGIWFTGRDPGADPPAVGRAGNLSPHRPHQPDRLARDREKVCRRIGLPADRLYSMRQVHGARIGTVDAATPHGAELRGVDALVTAAPDRALAVGVADCVPLLLAGPDAVAAVHTGRKGLRAGVVDSSLDALGQFGCTPGELAAVLGPAIGPCCYEVPAELQREVVDEHPAAAGTTSWDTPSLDLPAAVEAVLADRGVTRVRRHGGCTYCDEGRRWFSNRRDPDTGRQLGIIVRWGRS